MSFFHRLGLFDSVYVERQGCTGIDAVVVASVEGVAGGGNGDVKGDQRVGGCSEGEGVALRDLDGETAKACPTCTGFGSVSGIDWNRVINRNLSIQNDAVIPLRTPSTHSRKMQLLGFCQRQKIPVDVPFERLTEEQQYAVKFGKPPYHGVMGYFEMLQSKSSKFTSRIQLARFRGYTPCEACDGSGMADIARHIDLYGKSFVDVMRMTVSEALAFFASMPAEDMQSAGCLTPWEEAILRLRTMDGVGLGYLTLNRKSKTLSGGECQRLHLSCGLGRGLCDTLYVLDEPTAGLHPVDSMKLVRVMKSLQEMGNTLVVVEHDVDVIRQADHILELGPCGGEGGGCFFDRSAPGHGHRRQILCDADGGCGGSHGIHPMRNAYAQCRRHAGFQRGDS
jgi:excinuclease UvrABC ATPase subunit